ncbi:MAG: flagellar hook-length control protein FliK [Lachnospiraceae bacterium]|nr:flagellar hook-length control protein FliK [Lachnospiraceae bacterium]
MNISNVSNNISANINNYASSINQENNVNQTSGAEISNIADLKELSKGDSFSGKVIGINNNTLTIKLNNGNEINAKMAEQIKVNVGSIVEFFVKQKNSNGVVISPSNTSNDIVKQILNNNGFAASDKNIQITNALINNYMPTDKRFMQKIMQASYNFPNVSVDDIISMTKLNIPITKENIDIYNQYKNSQHQLTNDISNLTNSIEGYINDLANDNTINPSNEINKIVKALFNNGDISIVDKNELISQNIGNQNTTNQNEYYNSVKGNSIESNDNIISYNYNKEQITNDNISNIIENSISSENKEYNKISDSIIKIAQILNIDAEDLATRINIESDESEQILNKIINFSETKADLLNNLSELTFNNQSNFNNLITKEGFIFILKQSINKELSLDAKNMKDSNEIDDLYSETSSKLSKLINDFSGDNHSGAKEFSNNAKEMQQKLDFIQNINNMYAYAQLPVNASGNNFNSELFVYMNKKAKISDKKNISAMLHLDMDNLGPIDVHVTLNNSEVITKFYVEDEESARIIKEHMDMLQEALKNNGLNLHSETINRNSDNINNIDIKTTNSNNMVHNEIFQNELEKSVKRYTFDVRS